MIPSFRCAQRLSFFRLFRFRAEEQPLCRYEWIFLLIGLFAAFGFYGSRQKDIDRELFYC
ncbi:hypothetical protein GCWU000341_00013 [Oribacterium sp. oral taxon 078 str. F0262]|nr:hypothetical protein GCWU000341_00013 [Oribacterium sp. oral taxon 078 str. F0262]